MAMPVMATNDGVTVVSATQTQEEVNAAVGLTTDGKPVPKEPEESSEAQAETPAESEAAEETEGAEESEKRSKGKGGFQRRIDKLTAERYRLESEVDDLRAKLNSKQEPAQPVQAQTADGEPRMEDFQTIPDYVKAHTKWAIAETKKTEALEAQQAKEREVLDGYAKRVSEARAVHDDWDEVYESIGEATVPQSVQLAILRRKDGPELVYHLAKNPEIVQQLNEMDPIEAVSELGSIAATLSRSESSAPARKAASSAPAPIRPIGGGSTKSQKPLDQMNMKEYAAARRAGRTS